MKIKRTTRTIAGIKIRLTPGKRYLAFRPIYDGRRRIFPVTIKESIPGQPYKPTLHVGRLSYDAANKFINTFNNGKTSWQGRIWK